MKKNFSIAIASMLSSVAEVHIIGSVTIIPHVRLLGGWLFGRFVIIS